MSAKDVTVPKIQEKVADLYDGISIWKVDINSLREMDKNARVMRKDKFELLATNIARDKRLESLPLCTMKTSPGGDREFLIISGHHRTRAARKALVLFLYVMVIEGLTDDQVRSKQLAHNALAGEDDKQVLSEIYQSIADLEERIRSGIVDGELAFEANAIKADDIALNVNFEIMQIAFFPHQKEEFEDVVKLLDPTVSPLNVADLKDFKKLKATMKNVGMREDIRNISAILARMCAIVKEHYEAQDGQEEAAGSTVSPAEAKA